MLKQRETTTVRDLVNTLKFSLITDATLWAPRSELIFWRDQD